MLLSILIPILMFLPWTAPPSTGIDVPAHIAEVLDREVRADSVLASQALVVPYLTEIEHAANSFKLPAALLAGVVQEESRFDPWASRLEPRYMNSKRVRREANLWSRMHSGIPTPYTELGDRSRSYGLMQIMGETARDEGYSERYLSRLFLTSDGLRAGARHLALLLRKYPHDTLSAISAYNQGSARRVDGLFANARYVYRVTIAWRMYDALLRKGVRDE